MKRLSFLCFLAFGAALTGSHAEAQSDDFTLNRFRASETPGDSFAISDPADQGHLRIGAQLHLEYANDPLVVEEDGREISTVVSDQLSLHLGISLGLFDRLVLFVGAPIDLFFDGDENSIEPEAGIGDLMVGGRVRLLGERVDAFALSLQLSATFPTGSGDLRGDNFLSLHPEVLFEVRAKPLRLTANLGGRVRENQGFGNADVGDEFTWGLGVAVALFGDYTRPWETRVDGVAQVFGATSFQEFFGREETALEGLAGVKLHHESGFTAGLAGTAGFTRGVGTPDFRVLLNVGWATPPDAPEEAPPVERPNDRDGDGLLDPVDECPDAPEDFDQFEDEDGCPDPDNDQDGVLDVSDQCPLEPEDRDGWEDADGCPDPNNDGDRFPDTIDNCPNEPEDEDDFADDDGCPDIDNDNDTVLDVDDSCPNTFGPPENQGCPSDRDGDTVLDHLDNCPDEPGPPENQGCPQEQLVRIEEGRLEILDRVFFRTNSDVILPRSYRLLDNVAMVLANHPEIAIIRVEGHTDSRGDAAYNQDLSQRRAESVVARLVEAGLEAGRFRAIGFGEERPIDANETRVGRAANRRVEFNLGEETQVQQSEAGPGEDTID
ncbi:MAG: OmpA family protein [Myxococcota bacterium]